MIGKVPPAQFQTMYHIINDAAQAYKGVIPADCWKEPYMSAQELQAEIDGGVEFYGYTEKGALVGVMGIQPVRDITLIRHAYVLTSHQRRGIGEKLLSHLLSLASTGEVLVGTWRAAWWAVRFYEKHGFQLTSDPEKDRLLHKYWQISERQVETSVVLRMKRGGRSQHP
jgi:GNAT superfamily N-acetyltransferase